MEQSLKNNNKITYVTALLNIKRDTLKSSSFQRPFKMYLDTLKVLLAHLKDKNLVIYIEKEYEDLVKSVKSDNIIIKSISCDQIRDTEYYDKIQQIRNNKEWREQVGWLSESTQANLELYNPLIFQKIHLLDDVCRSNPFNDEYFVWLDAGIANAQCHPGYFSKDWFEDRLIKKLNKFLFICFPYEGHNEVHGFKRDGLHKFSDTKYVDRVARATFFGGKKGEITFLSDKYRELAHKTLDAGYMGTEESLFTILTYLYNDLINVEMIKGNGLVSNFFENLQNNTQNQPLGFTGDGSFTYLKSTVQQHPKVFDEFNIFFKENNNIDLVIEIGTGDGGMSMFLKDKCDEIESKFITFDIKQDKKDVLDKHDQFIKRDIDMRICDVFADETIDEIKKLINCHGQVLIMCDGNNQVDEFNTFSGLIKSGDIIMAHDYAPNKFVFDSKYRDKIWNWLEVQDSDIKDAVDYNNLKDYHKQLEQVAWVSKIKSYQSKTDLYVITFNSPEQFNTLVKSIKHASPELFAHSDKYVLNNSTDESTFEEYKKIFKEYNFTEFKKDNLGICGGRQFIAEHFDTTDNEYMLFFEDDMNMNGPESSNRKCKNGFTTYHPTLYNTILNIMNKEEYDFMKLSFTEFFGDNRNQWAWYNVPQQKREERWPHYNKLPEKGLDPDCPLTRFKNIKCIEGLPYADGEIYYCNWPQIVSKGGNKKMFLDVRWASPHEQTWMSHIYQLTLKDEVRSAILLASPISHDRRHHYKASDRVESIVFKEYI